MDNITVDLGSRKLQFTSGSHFINVPSVAVRSLKLETGDKLQWSLVGDTLQIYRVAADICGEPVISSE